MPRLIYAKLLHMTPTAYSDTVGHNFEISKKEERRIIPQSIYSLFALGRKLSPYYTVSPQAVHSVKDTVLVFINN